MRGDESPLFLDVGDLHRLPAHSGPTDRPLAKPDRRGPHRLQVRRRNAVRGPRVETLAALVELVDDASIAARQLDRAAHDRLEHGLEIEGGADSPADLAERLQLADRACQGMRPRLELPEQPDILDGDDGLVGEGLQELDLPRRQKPGLGPVYRYGSDRAAVVQDRDRYKAAESDDPSELAKPVVWIGIDVRNLLDGSAQNGPPGAASAVRRDGEAATPGLDSLGRHSMVGYEVEEFPIEAKHGAKLSITESPRILGDRVKDRLDIGGRAGDHAQNLARRRLLLEGLGEVAVASLELPEQADVLDGDDGLIGEGLQQLDLAVGEGPGRRSRHRDGADRLTLSDHRHRQHAPVARCPGQVLELVVAILQNVRVVTDHPTYDCPVGRPVGARLARKGPLDSRDPGGVGQAVVRRQLDEVAVEARHRTPLGVAQPERANGDRVEDGLDVGGRARDDAQNLAGRRPLLEGLGEVAVLGLELREQADILDGDDRLVGEGLEQLDLRVGEQAWSRARDEDHADDLTLADHGDPERTAVAARSRRALLPILGVSQDIRDVDDGAGRRARAETVSSPGRMGNARRTASTPSGAIPWSHTR